MWIHKPTSKQFTEAQIRAAYPNTSFPYPMPDKVFDYVKIVDQRPMDLEGYTVVRGEPAQDVDGIWYYQYEHVPIPTRRVLRDWEFRDRFTQPQLVGIMRAAMDGDNTAAFVWLALSTASDGVNLDNPLHIAGVQYIATKYPALGVDPAVVLA